MPLTVKTTPPIQVDAPPFRLRDMFFPEKLLDKTNWRANPLVVYAERRSHRPIRFAITRILELFLIYCWAAIISFPFQNELSNNIIFGSFMRGDINYSSPPPVLFTWFVGPITPFILIFLLLRYHLLINDQSNHMKTLSREKLGELLLTRLGNNDYFLHHFLLFCLRYRVLIAWAAIWAVTISVDVLTRGLTWIHWETWVRLVATLNIVMLTWVMGVYQYVTEWKWFAGGRSRALRVAYSLLFSAALSAFVLASSATWYWIPGEAFPIISLILVLPIAVAVTYLKGRRMSAIATEWLAARYQGESAEFSDKWIRPLDLFFVWRWKSPFSPLICGEKSRAPGFGLLLKCLPLSILIFAAFEYIRSLHFSPSNALYVTHSMRLSWALHSFVVCAIGIWIGRWFTTEASAENGRSMYLRALWWLGMAWLVLYVFDNYRLIWNASLDQNSKSLEYSAGYLITSMMFSYMNTMIYLLFAFAVGALAPKRNSKTWLADRASLAALCVIFFLMTYIMDIGMLWGMFGNRSFIASAIVINYGPFFVKYGVVYSALAVSLRGGASFQPAAAPASPRVP